MVTGDTAHTVALVGTHLDEAIIRSVADTRLHPKLGVTLPSTVTAYPWDRFCEAMTGGTDLLILGVSSAGVGWAIDRIAEVVGAALPVLMFTKGLLPKDGSIEVLPIFVAREIEGRTGILLPVMAVGGPCIAGELAGKRDTSIVIAGENRALLASSVFLMRPIITRTRRKTWSEWEVCAGFKKLYAIGVGSANGMLELYRAGAKRGSHA